MTQEELLMAVLEEIKGLRQDLREHNARVEEANQQAMERYKSQVKRAESMMSNIRTMFPVNHGG